MIGAAGCCWKTSSVAFEIGGGSYRSIESLQDRQGCDAEGVFDLGRMAQRLNIEDGSRSILLSRSVDGLPDQNDRDAAGQLGRRDRCGCSRQYCSGLGAGQADVLDLKRDQCGREVFPQ